MANLEEKERFNSLIWQASTSEYVSKSYLIKLARNDINLIEEAITKNYLEKIIINGEEKYRVTKKGRNEFID